LKSVPTKTFHRMFAKGIPTTNTVGGTG